MAASLNRTLRMLRAAVEAHEFSLEAIARSVMRGGDMPVFTGFNQQLERAGRHAARGTPAA